MIKKVKNTMLWAYVLGDLSGNEIVGIFYEKELQKTKQNELRIEKVIKRLIKRIKVKNYGDKYQMERLW